MTDSIRCLPCGSPSNRMLLTPSGDWRPIGKAKSSIGPASASAPPKDGVTVPRRSLIVAEDFDLSGAIDKFEAWASQMFFGGESFAHPDAQLRTRSVAGFLGANLALVPEQDTSWVEPLVLDWGSAPALRIAPENRWWRAIVELTGRAAQRCQGKFIVGTMDTHSNLESFPRCVVPSGFAWTWLSGPRPWPAP